jgi:hypothetical protein
MVAVMSLGLVGCDYAAMESEEEDYSNVPSMFFEVEDGDVYRVVYHKDTKVMYTISDSGYNMGNFTVMLDADGTPMLYE